MRTKLLEIYKNILNNIFNIIILTETWLNRNIFDSEIFDDRYHVFRRDRESGTFFDSKEGGGVLIAVHKSLNSFKNYTYGSRCEDLWVTIDIKSTKRIHLGALYLRPPVQQDHLHLFIEKVITFLNKLDSVIIIGDFNMSRITWTMNKNTQNNIPSNYNNQLENVFIDFLSSGAVPCGDGRVEYELSPPHLFSWVSYKPSQAWRVSATPPL